MMRKLCIVLIILFMLFTGCTTSCIPVHIDRTYISDDGYTGAAIIDEKSFKVDGDAYKVLSRYNDKFGTNETIDIIFIVRTDGDTYIGQVCDKYDK